MKKFYLLSIILCISITSYSQLNEEDVIFSLDYGYELTSSDINSRRIGLNLEYMVSNTVGLNYSVLLGADFIRFPVGFSLSALAIIASEAFLVEEFLYLGLIPEGVSFNINVNDKILISPYLNLLSLEYNWGVSEFIFNGGLGIRIKVLINDKILLMPLLEIQQNYNYNIGDRKTRAGASLGFRF